TKLVEQIKQNINEEQHKNPQNSYMLGKCVHMSKENAINIANKIAAYNLDTQFIKRMIQENDFCKMAFDKLEKYANEEIASVTISSVDDIINYNRLQGIWQKLPLDTTYYVLRQVLNNLQFSYNIELSGHSADILCAQICEKTDTAAVGCQNKIVYLYNLENAVCTQLLQTSTIPNIICFNTDGSQVAIAAETSDYNIPTITIWCPHTGQQLFQIKMPQNKIYNISYTDNKDHKNQLHVISSRKDIFNSCMQITTCSLNKGKESNKGSSNVPCTIPAQLTNRPSKITLTRYIIYMPILLFDLKTKLLIKNYYCPPLSLCLTALKNTQNADDLTNI